MQLSEDVEVQRSSEDSAATEKMDVAGLLLEGNGDRRPSEEHSAEVLLSIFQDIGSSGPSEWQGSTKGLELVRPREASWTMVKQSTRQTLGDDNTACRAAPLTDTPIFWLLYFLVFFL